MLDGIGNRPSRRVGTRAQVESAVPFRIAAAAVAVALSLVGCAPAQVEPSWKLIEPWVGFGPSATATALPTATPDLLTRLLPPTPLPGSLPVTPTPDLFRVRPTARTITQWHVVQPGESLGSIAGLYGVGTRQLANANGILNPNFLSIGQLIEVPPPLVQPDGPSDKILPDSGVIYGPASIPFDLNGFTGGWASHLNAYRETVDGVELTGTGIVQLLAALPIDPRLLPALRQSAALVECVRTAGYPLGYVAPGSDGLFSQLSWAADQLNTGYYRWRAGWAGPFVFGDGRVVPAGAGINAGTASLQYLFSQLDDVESWRRAMALDGFAAVYRDLFGDPFLTAIEPLVPDFPETPDLLLPFESGKTWSFTGGPHSAWGTGAGWAALDFAPPGYALGCVLSDEWVTAVADGPVIRSENGEVLQDLDGDGHEQTGWVIVYMHVESRDRVAPGTELRAGDRVGHPSCEGGVSDGTHLHLARRYNGEWISADGRLPFILDGWISGGLGREYDGTMTRGDARLEACGCRNEENQIAR
jgi:murein DD-endopeptidase MepM/ murein hydrolase activator NlpD